MKGLRELSPRRCTQISSKLHFFTQDCKRKEVLEFPEFLRNTAVHERNLLQKGHVGTGRCPGSLERTLKNFGQPFLVKRNDRKSNV